MAPKKTSTDPKSKDTAQAGTSAAMARGAALAGAMPPTRVTTAAIAKVRHLAAASTDEGRGDEVADDEGGRTRVAVQRG